ncbi:MAG: hypothetical protein NTZ05_20890, partial [Chloroflexi bacterium]|nr:hypothetical protein [Chloroflexota bacterium]
EVVLRPGDRLDTRPDARFSYRVEGDGYAFYFLVTPFALPLPQRAPETRALPNDLEPHSA